MFSPHLFFFFFFNDTATTEIYTLSLHDALPISFDDQLADLAAWENQPVVPGWNRLVGDADDLQGDPRKWPADTGALAGAGACGDLAQDFTCGDGGDRQSFRRAVGRVGVSGVGQDVVDPLQHRWRHGRSGHEHAPERGQCEVPLHAVLTHAVPDGRRAERLRGAVLLDGGDERGGIRSEDHTSELQSLAYLVCRLLLEKKK